MGYEQTAMWTYIFFQRVAKHLGDVTAFRVHCPKAFCPTNKDTMVNSVLPARSSRIGHYAASGAHLLAWIGELGGMSHGTVEGKVYVR